MVQNDPTNVFAAFEMLLEEIEVEIDFINQAGSKAFQRSDYDSVEQHRKRASQATELRDKLIDLRKEWEVLMAAHTDKEEEETVLSERHNMGRLQRGLRTPEPAFRQAILKALIEKGGSARINDVLTRVEQLMKSVLKPVDYAPLASDPEAPRWRNTGQWARNTMVKEGLLKSNSSHGIWEITEAGRKALNKGV
jgi:restriction system protein